MCSIIQRGLKVKWGSVNATAAQQDFRNQVLKSGGVSPWGARKGQSEP